jgi:hypothetical protein
VQYEEVLDHIERNKGTKNLDQWITRSWRKWRMDLPYD